MSQESTNYQGDAVETASTTRRGRARRQWPGPDATREQVDEWRRSNEVWLNNRTNIPHEAPPVSNGPSIVCSGCQVRIPVGKILCDGCKGAIGA